MNQPLSSVKPGVFPKEKSLKIALDGHGHKVYYTLDGSAPNESSTEYKDSIVLTKSTVVRAMAAGDSTSLKSPVMTATYIINEKHDLPIVSISVKESDLYDHNSGIYADGPGYNSEWPHKGANYFKKWRKEAHVEFFDGEKEGFTTDCALMIFGGFSRADAKKSFRLQFGNKYGHDKLSYDFFGRGKAIDLKNIVLRSGSQDYNRVMIRDEFFTSLMHENSPALLIQDYRPVAVYINAKYFGLYYFREKIDKHFVARHLNVPNDSITILMSVGYQEEGNNKDYNALMGFITGNDMKDTANYNKVKAQVDLDGLIDWKLGEVYCMNSDVGNIRYVRSLDKGSDRKWHFVFYDLDASWVGNRSSAFWLKASGGVPAGTVTVHNRMIHHLLENPAFRARFMERLSLHMHKTFSSKNACAVFDKLINTIKPEMKYNCERWPTLKYATWEKNAAEFRQRLETRDKEMLNDLREVLSITEAENKKYFGDLGF